VVTVPRRYLQTPPSSRLLPVPAQHPASPKSPAVKPDETSKRSIHAKSKAVTVGPSRVDTATAGAGGDAAARAQSYQARVATRSRSGPVALPQRLQQRPAAAGSGWAPARRQPGPQARTTRTPARLASAPGEPGPTRADSSRLNSTAPSPASQPTRQGPRACAPCQVPTVVPVWAMKGAASTKLQAELRSNHDALDRCPKRLGEGPYRCAGAVVGDCERGFAGALLGRSAAPSCPGDLVLMLLRAGAAFASRVGVQLCRLVRRVTASQRHRACAV